jgi:glutaconate CoA-transferase subunit B
VSGASETQASRHEALAVAISRTLRPDDVGFTGLVTGGLAAMYGTMIPLAAMELARHSHAPGLTSLLAGWCHNPRVRDLDAVPGSEFDPILLDLACEGRDMTWPFKYAMKRGDVTVGFSSGAQIDAVGNLNTVAIGPFEEPKVRLVGPILVPEHYALFGREIVMMPRHDRRVFVERVDYVAAVGFPEGRARREELGFPGAGPELIVTPLCVFAFTDEGRLHVRSLHPGVSPEEVREATGFDLDGADGAPPLAEARTTEPPNAAELELLRTAVDPNGLLRAEL